MKHLATYLLLVLGGNSAPTASDVTAALAAVGIESDSERLATLIADLAGQDLGALIASGSEQLAKFGGGGGGAAPVEGGAAPAAKKEEVKEAPKEEEMDLSGGMDMFGGAPAGAKGDY